jgi:predicted nuclease with TOPRIM domain
LKSELNYELEEKEKTIVSLKEQLDEANKSKELMNYKLKKNIEDYEELKDNWIS